MRNIDFFILLIRLFLAYIFFSAGVCKLTDGHFGQIIGPPWLEQSLAKYGLGFFAQVVAASQVLIGALLFTPRFSTLAAIALVPMNISILAVTVSMDWAGTPYVNGFFLFLNLLLLFYENHKFRFLFQPVTDCVYQSVPLDRFRESPLNWVVLGLGLLTLIAASFHILVATILGALTFTLAGLILCLPPYLSTLEKIIVALAVGNMLVITVASSVTKAPKVLIGNTLLILILLVIRFIARYRGNRRLAALTITS